jgi:nucleotide-binding universal stress UspA family protein
LREIVPEEARTGVAVRERLEAGSAPEQILRVAAEEQADLVVLGTSTHGRLGRLLLGSTSKAVVRGATCPVVSVPRAPWSAERDEGALVPASRGEGLE